MMQTYSQNDLVRFLYHETSTAEDHGIAFQLEDDGSYNERFKELLDAKRLLDSLKLSAPKSSVNRILSASRSKDLPAMV